jgi:hypothetical protein
LESRKGFGEKPKKINPVHQPVVKESAKKAKTETLPSRITGNAT